MPGIFAIADAAGRLDAADRLRAMLNAATHHPWHQVDSMADSTGGVALGRVSLGFVQADPQPAVSEDRTVSVVMDGELYHADRQRRDLETAGCRFGGASHAEILLHGYRHEGRDFLKRLSGKFSAAIWDSAKKRLILTNDRFGMRPLYWAKTPGRLLAAAEIKAILLDPAVSREPNRQGLTQFFTFGHYLGDATSLTAVHLLPPGGWLTYDLAGDRLSVERYADWTPEVLPAPINPTEWLDRIDAAFGEAVECRTRDTEHLGIALSGGLDARSILGAMDHERTRVTSLALGVPGCGDHRFASRLAALAGCEHHNFTLDNAFLGSFADHLADMVRLTDGQYLSSCIVLPTLPIYRDLGIQVLLRGHAGELMHMSKAYNFSIDRQALAIRDERALSDWAFGRMREYMFDGVEWPLLVGMDAREFDATARESLNACLARSKAVQPPAQRIWSLFLTERVRRETALSLVKFGSLVETRLPYLDESLVPLLLAAPVELKLGETIQIHILRRRRPDFLRVPNVNTGARVGASRFTHRVTSFRQRVLAKLGAPGHQPYERMGLWLRRELRPTVERLLLSDQCLQRGVFQPDTVRRLVDAHSGQRRNHTYLLLAMMAFELGRRMLADDEPADAIFDFLRRANPVSSA